MAVEELLPLADHAHVAVVENADLDRQLVLHGGGQLGHRHIETMVAVEVDHGGVGHGDLAPMAAGRPKPIVPSPPELMNCRGLRNL